MRLLLVLLAAALLVSGCGEPEPAGPTPAPGPAAVPVPEAVPPADEPGEFKLVVAGEGWPGRRAPVRIDGDRAGVTVRFLRCRDTLRAFSPEPSPDEPAIEWDEVATVPGDGRMPRLGAGFYRIAAVRGDREIEGKLFVTDLLPVFASSPDEVLVLVTDAVTGKAVPGARVLVSGPGEARAGTADAEGVFRAAFRVSGSLRIVVAAEGRGGRALFTARPETAATTHLEVEFDQDSYLRGDTVRFAGILRESQRLRPVRVTPRTFSVLDGRSTLIYRGELEDGPGETFSGTFPVPETVRAGRLFLSIGSGGPDATASVVVKSPEPPMVGLNIKVDAGPHARGAEVGFEIRGEWPDGAPLAGVPVSYRVTQGLGSADGERRVEVLDGRAILDEQGRLETSFVPPRGGESLITARVRIPGGGETAAAATVRPLPASFALKVTAASRHVTAGQPVTISVSASSDLDLPDPLVARLEVAGETRDITVPAELDLDLPPGMHRIRVTAEDAAGNPVEDECGVIVLEDFRLGGPEWSGSISLVPDREEYRPGDTARVLVSVPAALAGETILLTGAGPNLGRHRVLAGAGRNLVVPIEIPRGAVRDQEIVLRTVRNRRMREARATLFVSQSSRELRLRLDCEGANDFTAEVRDDEGRPVEGVVIVRGIDRAGRSRLFAPGLRLNSEGRTPMIDLPAESGLTLHAVALTPDGRRGEAEMVVAMGPVPNPSRPRARPRAKLAWSYRSGRIPRGRSEETLDLPKGIESVVIHLAGGPQAALRQALPALREFTDWPADRLRNELLALRVDTLLAMVGDGEPPTADRFARALSGLAAIDEPVGTLAVPEEVASETTVRALLEILGVENQAAGPIRRPDEDELEALLAGRCGAGWGSARETAEAVRILVGAVRLSDERTAGVRVRFGPTLLAAFRLDAESGRTITVPRELLRAGRARLGFEMGGDLPLDYAVSIGVRSDEPRRGGPLRITRAWRSTGEKPSAPHRGELVKVALSVRSDEPLGRVIVEMPLPAGARALSGGPSVPEEDHREIKPDRVLFYLREVGGKPLALIQTLYVTHRGEFLFPRAIAYPLDAPDERSESAEEMMRFR